MVNLSLKAWTRNKEEKISILRKNKMFPGIVYWKKQEPILLKINYSDFLKIFRKAWESNIINLNIDKKNIEVLVNEVQREPVTWEFIHVDFFALIRSKAVTTKIHLKFVWNSEATKKGAIIEEHMKEIEVKCLPKNLRDNFEVDLSLLKEIWDHIKLSDLKIDSEIYEVSVTDDYTIASASRSKKVEIEEVAESSEVKEDKKEWEINKEKGNE